MKKKSNWIVRVKATVTKDVYCDNCTKESAETEPFEHATTEEEVEQQDYEVVSVEENL